MPVSLISVISWLTTHALRLAIIGGLSALLGVGVYMKGRGDANTKCAVANTASIVQGIKDHARIKQSVMELSEPDVDSALSKWMRD